MDAIWVDGSVASLTAALARARQSGVKRISLRGGNYYDVSLELTAADSGLTLEAAPGETVTLHGGVPLVDWRPEPDTPFLWAALPPRPGSEWNVRMLQIAGRMAPRARFPADGICHALNQFDVPWLSSSDGGWQRPPTRNECTLLRYRPSDLPAGADVQNAEVLVYHSWNESCVRVAAVRRDGEADVLELDPPCNYPIGAFGHHEYVWWNLREGMTAPGQWYWDRARGRVIYWPRAGETAPSLNAVVPTRQVIVSIVGDETQPVRDITLRGLHLAVTTAPVVAAGFAARRYDGAITLQHADNVRLEGLTIGPVAGHAIKATKLCSHTTVAGCRIRDCGAGGIYVRGDHCRIADNQVAGIGRMFPSGIGIYGGGDQCRVSGNDVHDTTYSAIAFGGADTVIENNRLSDCVKVMHDGAAIYMMAGRRNIIRGNVARDIRDTGHRLSGATAYYLDERCDKCIVEENRASNVPWVLNNHMARNNIIRRNVLLNRGDLRITFFKCAGYTVEDNVIQAGGKISVEEAPGTCQWHRNTCHSGCGEYEHVQLAGYDPVNTTPGLPTGTTLVDHPGAGPTVD